MVDLAQNLFHCPEFRREIHRVKKYVAPEPSDRITGVIGRFGSLPP